MMLLLQVNAVVELTAMILPFGVSWFCTLLLWGCICFPSQTGHNIAHGYALSDEFSSHAGVLGPQTSNQFYSGTSSNINHDSGHRRDEMQPTRQQSFVSVQQEPVHHENNEDASPVPSLNEEMVPSQPDSGHEPDEFSVVPSASAVQKYEPESAGYQHPFGLLVKEHGPKKNLEGISFPTIEDFEQFIKKMKSSFLTPGSDLSRHFQTAREIMEKKVDSNEPDTSYGSNSAKEGTAHDDASENDVWSEPMDTVFEQSNQGAIYQIPRDSLSVPDLVDSTTSLISTSVYDNQDTGSALYPRPHLAATEHVFHNYGGSGGISGENTEFPEQTPSGSFFGEIFSFSGHVTASPVTSSSQDLSHYSSETSSITPLKSKNNMTPANVLSPPTPRSLSSYGKSLYVNAPRGQHHISDYLLKHRERPAPSYQSYQPTVPNESNDIYYTPIVHLPASSGSVSSKSDNLSPQSSSDHVGVQTSSPHEAPNQTFKEKQPVRSHQMFTVESSTSLHGSSRHNGYLRDQKVSVPGPSILTDQAEDEERSDLSEQTAIQKPEQMPDNTPITIPGGLDSTQSGISSASFNSLTNLAPTSASETAHSRLVANKILARNFGIKNMISDKFPTGDIREARNLLGSFSTPQRRGTSLSDGFVGATRAGRLQTYIQPAKIRKHPANVNKNPGNKASQPPKPLSASKVSASTLSGVLWKNGGNKKRYPPKKSPNMSAPFVNTYIVKSRNGYVRHKVTQSKTQYTPYQVDEGKTGEHQWKPGPRKQEYKNSVSHNAKEFEEP